LSRMPAWNIRMQHQGRNGKRPFQALEPDISQLKEQSR
jgi:hypothetical protein